VCVCAYLEEILDYWKSNRATVKYIAHLFDSKQKGTIRNTQIVRPKACSCFEYPYAPFVRIDLYRITITIRESFFVFGYNPILEQSRRFSILQF